MPLASDWHELAFKRMLRHAAENGYDRLAWVTGEQTADRYDLSKQVSKLEWHPVICNNTSLGERAVYPSGLRCRQRSASPMKFIPDEYTVRVDCRCQTTPTLHSDRSSAE